MTRSSLLAWVLLAVWAVWLYATQGWLADSARARAWLPDLGIAFLVALAPKLTSDRLLPAAVCLALARTATSVDPAAPVLAGFVGASLLLSALRSALDLESHALRAGLAAVLSGGFVGWLAVATGLRAERYSSWVGDLMPISIGEIGGTSLSTAFVALLFAGLLARLPGLRPLYGRPAWSVAASRR